MLLQLASRRVVDGRTVASLMMRFIRSTCVLSGMMTLVLRCSADRLRIGATVRPSGTWGTGSTQVRVGRPLDDGLRARAVIRPPLRLARMR